MSKVPRALHATDDDILKLLATQVHIGSRNLDPGMVPYVYKRKADGTYIFNLHKTWEKLILAARIIVTIENPADIAVISGRAFGQRAVLKFAQYTGVQAFAGRFTPGTFTNQLQAKFLEPRLLVATDPRTDRQPIVEATLVNVPVVSFCNSDSPIKGVDVVVPGNNRGRQSIGLLWWLLAREVLRLRRQLSRQSQWDIMVDMFIYRDPDEQEKDEQSSEQKSDEAATEEWNEEDLPAPIKEWGAHDSSWDASAAAASSSTTTADTSSVWDSTTA